MITVMGMPWLLQNRSRFSTESRAKHRYLQNEGSMDLIANNHFTFSLNNAEAEEATDCRKQQPLQRIHHVNDQTREQLKNCEGDETRK
jgi:hypothetical protein